MYVVVASALATLQATCLVVIQPVVHCEADCFGTVVDVNPLKEPFVATADTQVDRGDTADTGASTRHSEDVLPGTTESMSALHGYTYMYIGCSDDRVSLCTRRLCICAHGSHC